MDFKIFNVTNEQQELLFAMDVIESGAARELFQNFSAGKIGKTRVGKLRIKNVFYPKLKLSGLAEFEEHFAFYALEKQKKSFFSAASYCLFIWPIESNKVYIVPKDSVVFEKPEEDVKAQVPISTWYGRRSLCAVGNHECFLEKMSLSRTFGLGKKKIWCLKDSVVFHYSWTNPDPWVKKHLALKTEYKPMFLLRNSAEVLASGIQPEYPQRPNLFGYDIDEN